MNRYRIWDDDTGEHLGDFSADEFRQWVKDNFRKADPAHLIARMEEDEMAFIYAGYTFMKVEP